MSTGTPEGRALRAAARRILASLGKPDATSLTPDDVKDLSRVFEAGLLDGDGVVPPEQAGDDAAARQAILDAMASVGPLAGRNGKPGIDRAAAGRLLRTSWPPTTPGRRTGGRPAPLVFGDATGAAWEAVQAVRAKVDDYFARCRLAAMDPRGAALLNRTDDELEALAARSLGAGSAELAAFPLARAEAGRSLPLVEGVNPAWAAGARGPARHGGARRPWATAARSPRPSGAGCSRGWRPTRTGWAQEGGQRRAARAGPGARAAGRRRPRRASSG